MKTKFNEKYHNNIFNFLISKNSDNKRTIMDIDCFIMKFNSPYYFIIDHKRNNDKCSLSLYRTLATLSGVKLNDNAIIKCFIVRSDIELLKDNTLARTKDAITYIQEIKKTNCYSKNEKDYIEEEFIINNDEILVDFFKPEKHNDTKQIIKSYDRITLL
jgi:hypothetical protein